MSENEERVEDGWGWDVGSDLAEDKVELILELPEKGPDGNALCIQLSPASAFEVARRLVEEALTVTMTQRAKARAN